MGIDPTAALARARSQSRGRKRTRSEAPADVEMADAEQQKRLLGHLVKKYDTTCTVVVSLQGDGLVHVNRAENCD